HCQIAPAAHWCLPFPDSAETYSCFSTISSAFASSLSNWPPFASKCCKPCDVVSDSRRYPLSSDALEIFPSCRLGTTCTLSLIPPRELFFWPLPIPGFSAEYRLKIVPPGYFGGRRLGCPADGQRRSWKTSRHPARSARS